MQRNITKKLENRKIWIVAKTKEKIRALSIFKKKKEKERLTSWGFKESCLFARYLDTCKKRVETV